MALLLEDGVRYPFRGDRPTDRLAVGGLLGIVTAILIQFGAAAYPSLLSALFVGLAAVSSVALLGYLLRVFETTIDGDDAPPRFRPVGPLLRDGSRLGLLSLGYVILPLAIIAITIGGLLQAPFAPESAGFMGSLLFFGASTIVLLVVLTFGYVYPAAVGRLADGGRLRSAADLRRTRPVLGDSGYATGWLFASLVAVPGSAFLLTALSSATPFGVVAVFVTFYAHVVATRLVARGYRNAVTGLE
ncbi:DUF4013 domain-containing protein [Natronorubrum sulfidifaciens]|uniref:DUF4013 domain-containing protein n=1 Tax=Natronorubrum sulfidifaciens JCM 14089 TaxID=1230460 RepID=L9W1S3_9EURY|nr:DUF4013 domain-containing protein [Natronorubrum sulfidifaciens]ELY43439.1 hypothetical protein C495_13676 [Natronorubrum sulfidifaciens JCM 14089]